MRYIPGVQEVRSSKSRSNGKKLLLFGGQSLIMLLNIRSFFFQFTCVINNIQFTRLLPEAFLVYNGPSRSSGHYERKERKKKEKRKGGTVRTKYRDDLPTEEKKR